MVVRARPPAAAPPAPLTVERPGRPTGPVEVIWDLTGDRLRWSVANRSDEPVHVDGVSVVVALGRRPRRFLRHGYQSWSPTGVVDPAAAVDPSAASGSVLLWRAWHQADPWPAPPGEVRSEQVTVHDDPGGGWRLWGFTAARDHEGTVRLAGDRLRVEAWLDCRLEPGAHRDLHDVVTLTGPDPHRLLETWAAGVGERMAARTGAPAPVGWCSWYHWFSDIDETALRANLAAADRWPLDVFQLDDGYQPRIGDWTATNDRFPSGHGRLASDIAAAGFTPGLWLAPFLADPDSRLLGSGGARAARWVDGRRPLVGIVHGTWGGRMHVLDTTDPATLDALERTAAELVAAGWRYLKLDFTYAPTLPGTWADPTLTAAQRLRAGFEAVRRGAGDDVFLLGCGAPLGASVGMVDGMRIGPDVAPRWRSGELHAPGYPGSEPATANALAATLARLWMHRRWWINDPDCVMLRHERTDLTPAQVGTWAAVVGASGGMVVVSDDLTRLDGRALRLLADTVGTARRVDASARAGDGARCPDLLDHAPPRVIVTPDGARLEVDPATGALRVSVP